MLQKPQSIIVPPPFVGRVGASSLELPGEKRRDHLFPFRVVIIEVVKVVWTSLKSL